MEKTCSSCVDKLAQKLITHHKIDMIYAYELAEKGIERVENRDLPLPKVESGNPTDYTQTCTQGTCAGVNTCLDGTPCTTGAQCTGTCSASGSCGCPDPLPNSHLETACDYTCNKAGVCAKCVAYECTPTCTLHTDCYNGTCGYNCDPPRIWNPVTLTCDLPAVAEKILGDGIVFATN